MATTTLFLLLIAFISLAYIAIAPPRRRLPQDSQYPRGPPGKPLVGNLPDVSTTRTLASLSTTYIKPLHADQAMLR